MVIEGRNLSLIYDRNKEEETHALRDVSITIAAGESTAIVGPSGSGKSSLLYLISGLKKPSAGTVYFDDSDIEVYTSDQRDRIRRERFGFIFQKRFLINYMTVMDNILAIPDKNNEALRERAFDLLGQFGIRHLAAKKPFQLSGGQRQRVAVARALINCPDVIFADEPTASVDYANALEIISILRNHKNKNSVKNAASVVIVTHDRSILSVMDKIIEMRDGRILSC
jgi:putative ABC transport system ATP-binding protein